MKEIKKSSIKGDFFMELVKEIDGTLYTNSYIVSKDSGVEHQKIKEMVAFSDRTQSVKSNKLLIDYELFKEFQLIFGKTMEQIDKVFEDKQVEIKEREEQKIKEAEKQDTIQSAEKTISEYQRGIVIKTHYMTIREIIKQVAKRNDYKPVTPQVFNRYLEDKGILELFYHPQYKGYILSKDYADCGYSELRENHVFIRYNQKGIKMICHYLKDYYKGTGE